MVVNTFKLMAVTPMRRDLPLLVFLPGMDGTALSLQQQSAALKENFDARCFCLPNNDTTDWPGLVAQLVKLLSAEKASQPHRLTYLCGESFGACLALKTIAHAPALCDRLILINPASSFNRQVWSYLGVSALPWLPNSFYQLSAFGLLPFLISLGRVPEKTCQALRKAMQQVTLETAAWRLSLLNNFQLERHLLKQFCGPTLLVASAADRLLPSTAEVRQLMVYLSDPRLIVLEQSGHGCLLEKDISLRSLLEQGRLMPETSRVRMSRKNHSV
ncbi:MAG: alpha/beta hydrolase [Cyanobacteria bacterium P01_D01_bin.56]